MSKDLADGNIFIGAPIDQGSELEFLTSMVQQLKSQQSSFVVIANTHIGGRQIDCVIATNQSVSVVEVKSSYLPVRGDLNGVWSRLQASGVWRDYTNAYQQALTAKNSLRDAMATVKPVGSFYPDGYVVFTSGFAKGSEVTAGDFKVTVTELAQFLSAFKVHGSSPWSIEDWKAFAAQLKLIPVSIDDVIASPEERKHSEILKQYIAALVVEYEKDGARWLSEDSEQRSQILNAATTGTGCYITGASGCGKSLIAKWITVELASAGNPTFFFAAKNFTGSWAEFIRREVSLISDQSPSNLLKAISFTDKPIFLVLDGINELGAYRTNAIRGIRALARRLGAKLIITGQERKPLDLDGLCTVPVNRPSLDLKHRIAQPSSTVLNRNGLEILKAVSSGIEAEIVGQIGEDLKADATRLVLIDQYVRMRLGKHARAASFGMRRLASSLHEQVAFSMSEAYFDEFMYTQGVSFEDSGALFEAGLLNRRAGRISFSHEMIQNVCAAFDLARKATEDATTFGRRLSTPILEPIAGDVISAIEDVVTCRALLVEVTNPALLASAAGAEFGAIARSVAQALLLETLDACETEIKNASLLLMKKNDSAWVEWATDFRRDWNEAERARLCAIGRRAASGTAIDAYLGLCSKIDERLANERLRLADAAREMQFPFRSRSFELAYYGFAAEIGFTQIARACQPVFGRSLSNAKLQEFNLSEMSSGQLHFFLENRSLFSNGSCFAEDIIYILRKRFKIEPYHVQLAALHAVGSARQTSEETLEQLVDAINALDVNPANWAINSCVIDALKICGALEDEAEENRDQIRRELASVLGVDDASVDKDFALSLCVRMFDHPFDSIYWDEISALDENLRHLLYQRALGASDLKHCMSLAWLTRQVVSFEDVYDAPILKRFTALPDSTNSFPQEEWGAFVLAIRFFGRHGVELMEVDGKTPSDSCLADIRMLIYAAESQRPADIAAAEQAWQRLSVMPAQLVIGCLSEVNEALSDRNSWDGGNQAYKTLNLAELFPAECLKIARCFIADGMEAIYFHRVHMREIGPSFAFDTVGCYGDRSDIDHLREMSRAHPFAKHALLAIKSLDMVSGHGI